jgi:hypothetical protein
MNSRFLFEIKSIINRFKIVKEKTQSPLTTEVVDVNLKRYSFLTIKEQGD